MGDGDWAGAEAKAQGQRGVITSDELDTFDIKWPAIKWAATSGRLVRMFKRAYRFSSVSPEWEQPALAATMLAGDGSALSHSTAAILWGLNGFGSAEALPIHLSVGGRQRKHLSEGIVVHRPCVSFDVYRIRGLPVTRLARTIVDIAPAVTDEQLEIILDAAQQRHRALPRWLGEEVGRHTPRSQPGLSRLIELIALREGIATESPLETRVRRAIRAHGLLPPRPQFDVFDDDGFVMRADFAWPQHKVALHVDGFAWHARRTAFDRDAAQRSRLSSLDWMSITVTHTTLQGSAWLRQLALTLQRRTPQRELFRWPPGTAPEGTRS